MATVYVDRDSVQLVGIRIDYSSIAGGTTSPTALTVTVAVVATGTRPVSADFKAATWQTGSGGYYANLLVGTGTTVGALTGGASYDVYAKVSASPETPIVKSPDLLTVR